MYVSISVHYDDAHDVLLFSIGGNFMDFHTNRSSALLTDKGASERPDQSGSQRSHLVILYIYLISMQHLCIPNERFSR